MKTIKYRILIALLAICLYGETRADEKRAYPNISFVGPGGGKTSVNRDQFVLLVVEGASISYDGQPIPIAGFVDYVNSLLKIKGVSYIGVYSREGVKYGDVVRAIDMLRDTNAKDIGVSMIELPAGREP